MVSKLKDYKVTGEFQNRRIDVKVDAFSSKQAKFKAGLKSKAFSKDLGKFMKSSKIKVREE